MKNQKTTVQKLPTMFAPAERLTKKEVVKQSRDLGAIISESPSIKKMLDSTNEIIMLLNEHRQIIYVNSAFSRLLGKKPSELYGLRPGEALRCVHAGETDGGCGTTEFCQMCGAVLAIMAAKNGKKEARECRISLADGTALDLKLSATPFAASGKEYIFCTISDIADDKRRSALERIFFHDILNTAGIVLGYSELTKDLPDANKGKFSDNIFSATKRLIDDIQGQRQLLAAERGELKLTKTKISSLKLINDITEFYKGHSVAKDKKIAVDAASQNIAFTGDENLIGRVVGNMAKNALEASKDGQTVTIGCKREENFVTFWVHNETVMPRDVKLQIFQRSFSTKGTGRGLGTYSIKLLTEKYMNGRVGFISQPDYGTRFWASFPIGQ